MKALRVLICAAACFTLPLSWGNENGTGDPVWDGPLTPEEVQYAPRSGGCYDYCEHEFYRCRHEQGEYCDHRRERCMDRCHQEHDRDRDRDRN